MGYKFIVCSLLFLAACCPNNETSLAGVYPILGYDFGTIIVVEGKLLSTSPSNTKLSNLELLSINITNINNKNLSHPILIELNSARIQDSSKLIPNHIVKLIGYESIETSGNVQGEHKYNKYLPQNTHFKITNEFILLKID